MLKMSSVRKPLLKRGRPHLEGLRSCCRDLKALRVDMKDFVHDLRDVDDGDDGCKEIQRAIGLTTASVARRIEKCQRDLALLRDLARQRSLSRPSARSPTSYFDIGDVVEPYPHDGERPPWR